MSLTLASVAATRGRGAVTTALTLGLGVPRGTGCAVVMGTYPGAVGPGGTASRARAERNRPD